MQNTSMKRSAVLMASALGLAGALFAGAAFAADSRLNDANDDITRAIAHLKAAQSPNPKEFGGHRDKAIEFLTSAQAEIAKAKEVANKAAKDKEKTPKGGGKTEK